jgi:hypothetical protein
MDNYIKLTKTKKFIGIQPITLSNKSFNKNTNYYTTYKLDGKRHLYLSTSSTSGFLITSKLEFIPFKLKVPKDTILDGELYNNIFYVFDILFYKGVDVRNTNLTCRIYMLQEIKGLILKPYWSPYVNSLKYNFNEINNKYKNEMKINGMIDGIIFTPDESYMSKVLKWKPVNLLSIDFKIKKQEPNIFKLLRHNNKIYTKTIVTKKQFDNYLDNTVVEFVYKENKFVPIRSRPDKINSNYITVIKDNFYQIKNPVDTDKLLS